MEGGEIHSVWTYADGALLGGQGVQLEVHLELGAGSGLG